MKIISIIDHLYELIYKTAKRMSADELIAFKNANSDIESAINEIINANVGANNEYLEWIIKEVRTGASLNDVIPTVKYFHNNKQKLTAKERIIEQYTAKSLEDKIKVLEGMGGKRHKEMLKVKKADVEVFLEDDRYTIYQPKTTEEAKKVGLFIKEKFGIKPRWCILIDGSSFFSNYSAKNIVFYIAVSNKEVEETLLGVAYAIVRDQQNKLFEDYTDPRSGFTEGIGIFDMHDDMLQNNDPLGYLGRLIRDGEGRPTNPYYTATLKLMALPHEEKAALLKSDNSYEVEIALEDIDINRVDDDTIMHLLNSKDQVILQLIILQLYKLIKINSFKDRLMELSTQNTLVGDMVVDLLVRRSTSTSDKEFIEHNAYRLNVNCWDYVFNNFKPSELSINLTEEKQLSIVQKNGNAIKYITKPSEKIQLAAVQENSHSLQYIENPSKIVILTAIQKDTCSIRYVENPSEEVQLAAVQAYGQAIEYIKNPSEAVQLAAVQQDGDAIQYIANPSEAVQLAAVRNGNGNALKYIKSPSEAVQLAAVQENGETIVYIDNPSEAIQLVAVRKSHWAIRYIKNPSEAALKLHKTLWNKYESIQVRQY